MYQLIPRTQGLEDKGIFLDHAPLPLRLGRELWLMGGLKSLKSLAQAATTLKYQWLVSDSECKFFMVQAHRLFAQMMGATEPIKYVKTQKFWFGSLQFTII